MSCDSATETAARAPEPHHRGVPGCASRFRRPVQGAESGTALEVARLHGEERRRLERDLHDGAQQRLVSLSLAPVELAVYYVVCEALTNVAKYAHAREAVVEVSVDDGTLVVEIADDGIGGASMSAGSGLRGLAERLGTLGGTLELTSPCGLGTTLRASVPLCVAV